MKRQVCMAATLALAATTAPASADNYTIDPLYTIPTFEVSHLGFTTQSGRFNKVSGRISLDFPANKGSVDLTIYTASIDMATPAWSAHLMDKGLFNVEKFPTMNFRSQKLVFADNKVVAAEGEFTMLGVTKPLKVTVSRFQCLAIGQNKKTVCGADVTANLKRSDFGLAKYIPEVSDEIHIRVPIEAYKN
jgi:polyisoprenoid-binding protein YceI